MELVVVLALHFKSVDILCAFTSEGDFRLNRVILNGDDVIDVVIKSRYLIVLAGINRRPGS